MANIAALRPSIGTTGPAPMTAKRRPASCDFPASRSDNVGCSEALSALFRPYFEGASREHGLVAGFDTAGRLVAFASRDGDIGQVPLFMSAVRAVIANQRTCTIIIAHNHVVGTSHPSSSDIDATRRIASACTLLGLRLRDHLIFAGDVPFSFARAGIL